ncbi:MAG: hypothetical protein SPF34_04425 [Helicobacter sp.]|nr:hypothetical protein [Helicobacter sp.]MDY5616140.1 hypothetical protein [Helicobacter sp.]
MDEILGVFSAKDNGIFNFYKMEYDIEKEKFIIMERQVNILLRILLVNID